MKKILFLLLVLSGFTVAQRMEHTIQEMNALHHYVDSISAVVTAEELDSIVNQIIGGGIFLEGDWWLYDDPILTITPAPQAYRPSNDSISFADTTTLAYDDWNFDTPHNWVGVGSIDISGDTLSASDNFYVSDFSSDLDGWTLVSGSENSTLTWVADTMKVNIITTGFSYTTPEIRKTLDTLTTGKYYTITLEYSLSGVDWLWTQINSIPTMTKTLEGTSPLKMGFTALNDTALFQIKFDGMGIWEDPTNSSIYITSIAVHEAPDSTVNHVKLDSLYANLTHGTDYNLYVKVEDITENSSVNEVEGHVAVWIGNSYNLIGSYTNANIYNFRFDTTGVDYDIKIYSNNTKMYRLNWVILEPQIPPDLTGDIKLQGTLTNNRSKIPLSKPLYYTETSSSYSLDASKSNYFYIEVSNYFVFDIINAVPGDKYTIEVYNSSGSDEEITFNCTSVDTIFGTVAPLWDNGLNPSVSAGATTIFTINVRDYNKYFATAKENYITQEIGYKIYFELDIVTTGYGSFTYSSNVFEGHGKNKANSNSPFDKDFLLLETSPMHYVKGLGVPNITAHPSYGWYFYAFRDSIKYSDDRFFVGNSYPPIGFFMLEDKYSNVRFVKHPDTLYRVTMLTDLVGLEGHNQAVKDYFKAGYESAGGTWTDSVRLVQIGGGINDLIELDSLGADMVVRPFSNPTVESFSPYYPIPFITGETQTAEQRDDYSGGLPHSIAVALSDNGTNKQYWDVEFLIDSNGTGPKNLSNGIGYFGGQMLFVMDSLNVNAWTARYLFRDDRSWGSPNGYGVADIDAALAGYDSEFDYDALDIYKHDSTYP